MAAGCDLHTFARDDGTLRLLGVANACGGIAGECGGLCHHVVVTCVEYTANRCRLSDTSWPYDGFCTGPTGYQYSPAVAARVTAVINTLFRREPDSDEISDIIKALNQVDTDLQYITPGTSR